VLAFHWPLLGQICDLCPGTQDQPPRHSQSALCAWNSQDALSLPSKQVLGKEPNGKKWSKDWPDAARVLPERTRGSNLVLERMSLGGSMFTQGSLGVTNAVAGEQVAYYRTTKYPKTQLFKMKSIVHLKISVGQECRCGSAGAYSSRWDRKRKTEGDIRKRKTEGDIKTVASLFSFPCPPQSSPVSLFLLPLLILLPH
jgi:hypothetical protein